MVPRPTTTTQQLRRATTTTRPPAATTTTQPGCRGWACGYVNSGVSKGYLPESFDPDRDTNAEDLHKIIEAYGDHNNKFDTDAALEVLKNTDSGEVDRGDMFNVIAAGLGITYDPDDPFKVAAHLADRGILLGHDRDGDGVSNPYTRPDADPDSTMNNEQLAAFLDRINIKDSSNPDDNNDNGRNGRKPFTPANPDPNKPGAPNSQDPIDPNNPSPGSQNPPDDPADVICSNGLTLDVNSRSDLLNRLQWVTLVDVKGQGEPGKPWPPHISVPGGSSYLHLSGSPMWPVVSSQGGWNVIGSDGCSWRVASFEARLAQLLPWEPAGRAMIVSTDALRPAAGFGAYLQRWDSLNAAQKAQAKRNHIDHNFSAPSCPTATATVSADSYRHCRWELPTSGVWNWHARVCFESATGGQSFRDCESLADGIEWFLEIVDYTSGVTLQHPSESESEFKSK